MVRSAAVTVAGCWFLYFSLYRLRSGPLAITLEVFKGLAYSDNMGNMSCG
jgi:hypothetical protein